ncbi:MAG: hypothetical protein HKN12_02050 [Gemmatimonadetes bacterium]|nr:hypothetical protein [Gemmatimonadota bacterium]
MRLKWIRTFRAPLVLILLGVFVAACGDEGSTMPDPDPDPVDPVFPSDFATSFTEVRDFRSGVPHPSFLRVYANSVGAADYTAGNYPLPEGTVLVKEIYNDPAGSDVFGWVVMQKREAGFSSGSGDWYWQEVDSDRTVLDDGSITNCIGCHNACTSTDWVCAEP